MPLITENNLLNFRHIICGRKRKINVMRITSLFIACILLALYLTSCTKTSTRIYYTKYNNPELDHFSFQPGTYWIFRDSLTGKEDSIVVTSTSSDTIILNEQRQYAEQRTMQLQHYSDAYTATGQFFIAYNYISFYDGSSSQIESSPQSATIVDATILGVPYTGLKRIGYSYAQMLLKDDIGIVQYTTYNYSTSNYMVQQLVRYNIVK
jgi:hypothetical protein